MIRIFNPHSGQCMVGPMQGHTESILSIAYSPDGSYIVSGSADRTLRIWSTSTGQYVAGPFQHTDWVSSVAYSPHNNCIISGSFDGTIRVWTLQPGVAFEDWHQKEDGWVETSNGDSICWIPPWARHVVYHPRNLQIISLHHPYKLGLHIFPYAKSWIQCWI
ncbi:WD40-repeat-containing domain protein [Butyriboletus roseoflavus]|nr:WD40-repeat-containing domain protein [Butyriboletus roseoflavus]